MKYFEIDVELTIGVEVDGYSSAEAATSDCPGCGPEADYNIFLAINRGKYENGKFKITESKKIPFSDHRQIESEIMELINDQVIDEIESGIQSSKEDAMERAAEEYYG